MNAVTQEMGPCPCLHEEVTGPLWVCLVQGTKLTKYGHLKGCTCRSCLGRRNKSKGRRSEAKVYRALRGEGPTKKDDLMFTMSLDVAYEHKSGAQIPKSIRDFIASKFLEDALRQAEKKKPVGVDCNLVVTLDLGRKGMWMVGPLPERGLR